jgi:CubicO group peptidase (beta-lactamase class C family)
MGVVLLRERMRRNHQHTGRGEQPRFLKRSWNEKADVSNLQQPWHERSSYGRTGAICANPLRPLGFYAGGVTYGLADQDRLFADAFGVIEEGIADRAFPGASISVTLRGKLVALKSFGQFTFEADSPVVSADTIFDVASVTKVVATTSMAMILYEGGLLDLEAPVMEILPEFVSDALRRNEVTFHMLLAHSSGLPAYEKLYQRASTREALLKEAFKVPLKSSPGTHAEYSDIGFILLGVALERLAEERLDSFAQREIFGPLAMAHTTFNPSNELRQRIPPTADDKNFRQRVIQGEIQDENASVLGGVAGHAGLFSTARDLATFAQCMLNGGEPLVRGKTVALFTRREISPAGTSRALGWDTPSAPSQSGKYFSAGSFGHLGYTGTSLWIDPVRQLSVTLLTNRTWPDCFNLAIKQIRPKFHDAVVEALSAQGNHEFLPVNGQT